MRHVRQCIVVAACLAVGGLVIHVSCGGLSCRHKMVPPGTYAGSIAIAENVSSTSGWLGLVERPMNPAPPNVIIAFLGTDYVVGVPETDSRTLVIWTRDNGSVRTSWTWGREWYFKQMVRSRNGEYVAVCLNEELTVTGNYGGESCRVGIIGGNGGINWLEPIRFSREGVGPRAMAISDDGRMLGIVGTGGAEKVEVWNVDTGKMVWRGAPEGESAINDVAFSPDGKKLYVGGTTGWVYVYESCRGELSTRFLASKEATPVFGCRVSRIDVSADGSMVAAGTGPGGDVYVWDADSGKSIVVIATKKGTVADLAFSPDCEMIAVCGTDSNLIGVWLVRAVREVPTIGSSSER